MTDAFVQLVNGGVATIDEADLPIVSGYVWRGARNKRTLYAYTPTRNGPLAMHRLILDAPADANVDHKDHDGLNNRRSNIRLATDHQSAWNTRKQLRSTSPYKGVHYQRSRKRWRSAIRIDGRLVRIGDFLTAEEAARAYDAKARETRGEFAYLNFPDKTAVGNVTADVAR